LIPLAMTESVIAERTGRRNSVAAEVSTTWGGAQTIAGPVLVVPYRTTTMSNANNKPVQTMGRASFLPEALDVQGIVDPDLRKRNLFKVVVYKAHLRLTGRFNKPDMASLTRAGTEPLWDEATVNIGITDPRGIARRITLKWNGQEIALAPGVSDTGLFAAGLHAPAPFRSEPASAIPFSLDLDLNGTRDLRVVPSGTETSMALTSTWPHPGFVGAPLPEPRIITDQGFSASWRVPYFGRGFPPAWTDATIDRDKLKAQCEIASFGVAFIQPVDIYQQAERAVKYAALFIVLTFVVFFLCEVLRARLLHPVQYVFIGFAICVFYLLLLSISEHVGFDTAYASAATATTLLIGVYSVFALGGAREGVLLGAAVAALYGFLYLLLRLEDYALLAGSLGLFAMLAVLMLTTRRVNWYELRLGTTDGRDRIA